MNLFAKKSSSPTVLILGAGERAGIIYNELIEPKSRFQCPIVGFVPLEQQASVIPKNLILQIEETLAQLAEKMNVTEIVVAQDHSLQKCPIQQLLNCKLAGIQLSDVDSFLQRFRGRSHSRGKSFDSLLANFLNRFHWY